MNLKNLTFGFEIEGVFKEGMNSPSLDGRFVSDRSVGVSPTFICENIPEQIDCSDCEYNDDDEVISYCPAHHAIYHREGEIATEFESKVYSDLDECLEDLGKFTKETHNWNQSCGLHFHVSNENPKKLFAIASNFDFLQNLFMDAHQWCACQKSRLQNERACQNYYRPYDSKEELRRSTFLNKEKYRMCRFHQEYQTLEFRFLAPCEHKVENVQKLLEILTTYLDSKQDFVNTAEIETDSSIVPLLINKRIRKVDMGEILMKLEPEINNKRRRLNREYAEIARQSFYNASTVGRFI
jgi:hypothetical protein